MLKCDEDEPLVQRRNGETLRVIIPSTERSFFPLILV